MNCCDEYCCNHGCNQGRDCPARVSKIGCKDHGKEPMPDDPALRWATRLVAAITVVEILIALVVFL